MAPTPKRKQSTRRTGKRRAARKEILAQHVTCKQCSKPKVSHRICTHCGK